MTGLGSSLRLVRASRSAPTLPLSANSDQVGAHSGGRMGESHCGLRVPEALRTLCHDAPEDATSFSEHEEACFLREAENQIRLRQGNIARSVLEIGNILLFAKERTAHGSFTAWIEQGAGLNKRSAQRFMAVARTYRGKNDSVSLLRDDQIRVLAQKAYTDERVQVFARFETGDIVTQTVADDLISARKRIMSDVAVDKSSAVNTRRAMRRAAELIMRHSDVDRQRIVRALTQADLYDLADAIRVLSKQPDG